ncbi:SMC-Scp complex subunit ScpB [Candidatus Woesearchaeota archaeon]|nr:SMC-Scp complex subunit ScpB [Candidatus Woesearchaeota archaeon]
MADQKKPPVKSKVEAVLFSTGHRISLDEMSRLCRSGKEEVLSSLKELQHEYDEKQSSLMLAEEGDFWKFTVRDHFIPIVRKIVTETELTKSVMETLAVIAFKYPILQSDLIKIRTNKAYDHLVELEKSGYITRQKRGRTNLVKLTEKFFKYFDLTEENLRDKFKDFESIAKAIKEKELEVEGIKEDQRKKAEELKQQDEKIRKEIESLDQPGEEFKVPLETYEAKQSKVITEEFVNKNNLIVEKEKMGELEIVEDVHREKHPLKKDAIRHRELEEDFLRQEPQQNDIQNAAHLQAEQMSVPQEKPNAPHVKREKRGIKLTPEMEKKVEQKVDEMLGIQAKSKEKEESSDQSNQN